ncbi:MAG: hypothetical protein H6841_05400 [Planctomycetes bacterium]|nr:hypothetical protein [Planctomycetota bacterium]MCB9935049.1 hypothetical protein [Planctomycetota bacterium]
MKYATAITLMLALLLAGCGGGEYQPPPKANGRTPSGNNGTGGGSSTKAPTGPSFSKQYEPEAKAALAAWSSWSAEKTPANFAKVGTHLYNAMRYKIMTERNGHSISNFYKSREVGELFADWKKTIQPGDWESDPDYQAAFHAYKEVQQ